MTDEQETPKLLPAEVSGNNAVATQQTVKEIQGLRDRMIIARGYPRDAAKSQERIAASCKRPSFAEAAIYKVPRAGGAVEGPSIQMALEVARQWGNMDVCMGREIPTDDEKKSTFEVSATDLETNFHVNEILTVKHVRYSKAKGLQPLTNPDDIYLACSARASKRVRECILKVVPRDVTDLALEQCRQTSASSGGLEQRVRGMVAKFAAVGVTEIMLTDHLRKPLKDVVSSDLMDLAGVYTSINEGASVAEHFGNHTDKETGEVTVITAGPEVVLAADIPKSATTDPGTTVKELAAAVVTLKGKAAKKSTVPPVAQSETASSALPQESAPSADDAVDATIVEEGDLFSV